MKNKFSALLVALLTFGFATSTFAQYDDLYSIPSDDNEVTHYEAEEEYVTQEAADYDEYDEYSYLDDQDYYYSSRIRRFNRVNTGFGYYSPFFTDAAYYNAAYSPGVSIYLGNPFSYNAYRRAVRSPFRGYGFNSAYSPFYNPYNVGRIGGGFGGYNGFNNGFGGYGAASAYNAYCPPTSYGNNLVRTSRGANNATYGPRGTSTTNASSRSNDSSVRRGTSRVIRSAQGNDAASSRSRSTSTRANTNTRTNRTYDRSNNTRRNYNSTRSNSSNRRSYSTPRSNSSSRSISTPRRSSSRSISSPRSSSSRSSSIRSSSSSRRQ